MKNNYLTQSQKLYTLSKKELNKAKLSNDNELARDGAGKAWIATVDAFRGFLLSRGLSEKQLPKSERQCQEMMAQYCDTKMRSLYYSLRSQVHEDAYYEGRINYILLFDAMNELKKFIHRCGNGG